MGAHALFGVSGAQGAQVLLTPWRKMSVASRVLWALVAGVFPVLTAIVAAYHWDSIGPGLLSSYLCGLMTVAWAAQISSHFEQNHPVTARLVPGQLAVLRRVSLAVWLALTAAGALAMWLSGVGQISLALSLLLAGAVLALVAVMTRWWTLWIVVWLLPMLAEVTGLNRLLTPAWGLLRELWLANPWTATLGLLMLMGWGLTRLFGDGSAAHVASYRRMTQLLRASRSAGTQRQGWAAFGPVGEAVGSPLERLPAGWLAHLLRHAAPTERSVMARAEVVLHGPQHWVRHLSGVAIALAIVLLAFVAVGALTGTSGAGNWRNGVIGMAIGLTSAALNPALMLPGALWQSRREQALLVLLPGMPRGAALNRAVAWRQGRHVGIAWALTTAILAGLASRAGDPLLLCLSAGAAPVIALWLWRSPARLPALTAWANAAPVLVYLALALALYATQRAVGWPMWQTLLASLLLSLPIGVWRWRRLGREPAALPAGRLA